MASPGCHTAVNVRKVVEGDEPGLRYSLPQPFLVTTPMADGKLDVHWEYLPDSGQQYAIDSCSLLASHNLTIKTSNGLLTSVDWTGDSAAVLAEATKAVGAIEKQKFDSQLEAAKETRSKSEEEQKALREARLGFDQAQAAVDSFVAQGIPEDNPDFVKARVALEQARAKLLFYQQLYGSDAGVASMDDPSSPGEATTKEPGERINVTRGRRHGPVWFRLEECPRTGVLQLVAVQFPTQGISTVQGVFETYTLPKVSSDPPSEKPDPSKVELETKKLNVKQSELPKEYDVVLVTEVEEASDPTLTDSNGDPIVGKATMKRENSKLLKVKLEQGLNLGKFEFSFNAKTTKGKHVSGLFTIQVDP